MARNTAEAILELTVLSGSSKQSRVLNNLRRALRQHQQQWKIKSLESLEKIRNWWENAEKSDGRGLREMEKVSYGKICLKLYLEFKCMWLRPHNIVVKARLALESDFLGWNLSSTPSVCDLGKFLTLSNSAWLQLLIITPAIYRCSRLAPKRPTQRRSNVCWLGWLVITEIWGQARAGSHWYLSAHPQLQARAGYQLLLPSISLGWGSNSGVRRTMCSQAA